MIILLLLSFVALACGPLLFSLVHQRPRAMVGADAFVLVAVVGLVIVHVLPQSIEVAGWAALAAACGGFILTSILEGWLDHHHHASPTEECVPQPARRWGLGLPLAIAALGLHAILDGTTFAEQGHLGEAGVLLGWAVILHRLPIGFAVWWWLRPLYGAAGAWSVLILVALCTALGMVWGDQLTAAGANTTLNALQAAVAGSLLHVVMHRSPAHQALLANPLSPKLSTKTMASASAWGGVVALVLIAAVSLIPHGDHAGHGGDGVSTLWVQWLGWAACALTLSHLLCAVLVRDDRSRRVAWLHAGDMPKAASLTQPWWIRAGCSLPSLVIACVLIGPLFAAALLMGHCLLSVVLWLWQRDLPVDTMGTPMTDVAPTPLSSSVQRWHRALRNEVDTHAPWAILALVLVWCMSMLGASTHHEHDAALWSWLHMAWPTDVLLAMLLASLAYWRSLPSTLVMAMALVHGLSWGAALTFLWAGPLLYHQAWSQMRRQVGWRVASGQFLLLSGTIAALATVVAGAIESVVPTAAQRWHWTLDHNAIGWLQASVPGGITIGIVLGFGVLIGLYGGSLWRQGVRQFVSRIVPRHADDKHAIPEFDNVVACGACEEHQHD